MEAECINSNSVAEASEDSEIFRITFKSTESSEKYKLLVKTAIENCLQKEKLKIEFVDCDDTVTMKVILLGEAAEEEAKSDEDFIFQIDVTPKADSLLIPSYKRATKDVYDGEPETVKVEKIGSSKGSQSCFNCSSSEHSLRDCPEQRNQSRINKAKKQFCVKGERYHVDVEQRFAHLKAGTVSENLLKALGVRKNAIPHFFYRMRLFGYPPGWLEDAKVKHSGISMFDTPGVHVGHSDEEEGEVDVEKHKFDVSKIIGFPGFNVSPGDCFFDDYEYYGVPPFNPRDDKDMFVQSFGDNIIKGYKRKKIRMSNSVQDTSVDTKILSESMEIEDGAVLSPPPPLPVDNEEEATPIKVARTEETESKIEPTNELSSPESPKARTTTLDDSEKSEPIMQTLMGTPIFKFSPYEKLPASNLFQEGVSDVINFENLPDSTGKYKNIERVIKKVRTVISKIQNEDD